MFKRHRQEFLGSGAGARREILGEVLKKVPTQSDWFTPTEFLMEISRVMGGSYYGLSLTQEPSMRMKKTKLDDCFYLEAEAK